MIRKISVDRSGGCRLHSFNRYADMAMIFLIT